MNRDRDLERAFDRVDREIERRRNREIDAEIAEAERQERLYDAMTEAEQENYRWNA